MHYLLSCMKYSFSIFEMKYRFNHFWRRAYTFFRIYFSRSTPYLDSSYPIHLRSIIKHCIFCGGHLITFSTINVQERLSCESKNHVHPPVSSSIASPEGSFCLHMQFPSLQPFHISFLSGMSLIPGGYHCPGFSWLYLFLPQRRADGSPDPSVDLGFFISLFVLWFVFMVPVLYLTLVWLAGFTCHSRNLTRGMVSWTSFKWIERRITYFKHTLGDILIILKGKLFLRVA